MSRSGVTGLVGLCLGCLLLSVRCTHMTAPVLVDDLEVGSLCLLEKGVSGEEFRARADEADGLVIFCEPTGAFGIEWGRREYHRAAVDAGAARAGRPCRDVVHERVGGAAVVGQPADRSGGDGAAVGPG